MRLASSSLKLNFITPTGFYRTFAQKSERSLRRAKLKKHKKAMKGDIPELKATLRSLYMKTHPDLFGQWPELQATNEASYKELLGLLDSIQNIQSEGKFPAAKKINLKFFLLPNDSNQPQNVSDFPKASLKLHTTGANCNTVVEEALGDLFLQCKLPPVFKWPANSWGMFRSLEDAKKQQNDKHENSEDNSSTDKHAPAFRGSRSQSPDLSTDQILDTRDTELQLLALVPWINDDEQNETLKFARERFVNGNGFDEWQKRGFIVKPAIEKLWNDESMSISLNELTQGLDAPSAIFVQRVYYHRIQIAKDIEKEMMNTASNDASVE